MVVLQCSAQLLVIVMVKVDLNKMNLSCPSLAQLIPPTLKHLTFWSSFMKFTNNNGDTITGVLVCKTKKKKNHGYQNYFICREQEPQEKLIIVCTLIVLKTVLCQN